MLRPAGVRAGSFVLQLIDAVKFIKLENLVVNPDRNTKFGDNGFCRIPPPNSLLATACGPINDAAPDVFEWGGHKADIWSLGGAFFAICAGCGR
jgi:serine/threonine protein kinase